jgi:hypothetical protein
MLGDVEEHAFGAVKLHLKSADAVAGLVDVMRAAQCLDLLRKFLDVVDEVAEWCPGAGVAPIGYREIQRLWRKAE